MAEFWDERYSSEEYAYGKEPNEFFRAFIDTHPAGSILLPADGEGRNAVYAAVKGWSVTAFDQSSEARRKALLLASEKNVSITYTVVDASIVTFDRQFDAVGFFFLHLSASVRKSMYAHLLSFLRPGGLAVLEGFNQQHLRYREQYGSGGPGEPDRLFTFDSVKEIFAGYRIDILEEKEVELREGKFHYGLSSVIRCIASKGSH
jgi:cyclopropane fatty-acyl-phospholipid synthase-like methyltransferase